MKRLTATLYEQLAQADQLEAAIKKNLDGGAPPILSFFVDAADVVRKRTDYLLKRIMEKMSHIPISWTCVLGWLV